MNVFPIAPAESRYLWLLIPVTVLLLGVLIGGVGLLATSVRGAHASRFEIEGDGLRLVGDLYGRVVPKRDLRVDAARRVDLAREAGCSRNGAASEPRSLATRPGGSAYETERRRCCTS